MLVPGKPCSCQSRRAIRPEQGIDDNLRLLSRQSIDVEAIVSLKAAHYAFEIAIVTVIVNVLANVLRVNIGKTLTKPDDFSAA